MQLVTISPDFLPDEKSPETKAHIAIYRLTENELEIVNQNEMKPEEIMSFCGFYYEHFSIEAGEIYKDYNFISLDRIYGILYIKVKESINI